MKGDIAILHSSGQLTLGEVAFREAVDQLLEAGVVRLVVDLSDVKYIDSSGNGAALPHAFVATRNRGGDMVLVNPQKQLMDIFTITKLNRVYRFFPDIESAIKYLQTQKKTD